MGEWSSTRITNMRRRVASGVYYAQIKIAGKTIRKSLETKKLEIARVKLPLVIRDLKEDEDKPSEHITGLDTLGGCIDSWLNQQLQRPDIKESTKDYWKRCSMIMRKTLPCDSPPAMSGEIVIRTWWEKIAKTYHTTFVNNLLSSLVAVLELQINAGYRKTNPAKNLKRVKAVEKIKRMPSPEDFSMLINHVRLQKKRHSNESADFMEWIAYCGMRPSEVMELNWEDVGVDRITVRGGESGTKNRRERMIPIIEALEPIIRKKRQPGGKVFYIKTPRIALRNACKRLEIDHMRVYDLRHLFATRCIESGVDFATVGKWLGHSDGGSLAARVYGHVRDEHGLQLAKKVKF
jgi:integrase